MKFTQKYSLALLFVVCALQVEVLADGAAVDTHKVIFHLFNPLAQQGAQKRINDQLVEKALASGRNFNKALMDQVRHFLLSEAKAAFEAVSTEQGISIDSRSYAELLLQEKLERPYFEKHGKYIYSENPLDLPEHVFTYFVNPYLHSALRAHALPEHTRDFSFITLMGYLQLIRVGTDYAQVFVNYTQAGINIANEFCDKLGIVKP